MMSDIPKCCVCGGPAPNDILVLLGVPKDQAWCGDCKQRIGEEIMERMADKLIRSLKK